MLKMMPANNTIFGVKIIIAIVAFCMVTGFISAEVEADSGSGNETSEMNFTGCSGAKTLQNASECTSEKGGASWHIFRTDQTPVSWVNYTRPVIFSYGYDYQIGVTKCLGQQYYLAYVYDGWDGAGNGVNNTPVVYRGPLNWGSHTSTDSGEVHTPQYHWTNATTYEVIMANIAAGVNVNGWRISGTRPNNTNFKCVKKDSDGKCTKKKRVYDFVWESWEATKFWRIWQDPYAGYIPSYSGGAPVGYFCANNMDDFSGSSTLNIKVKNESIGRFNDKYREGTDADPVYAKPGDMIRYHTDYSPGAQGAYNKKAQYVSVNNGSLYGSPSFSTAGALLRGARGSWENKVTINAGDFNYSDAIVSGAGDTGYRSKENPHEVLPSEAGNDLDETAATTSNTPVSAYVGLRYSPSYGYILAKVNVDMSDTARVFVPYNFINEPNKPGHSGEDDPTPNDNDNPSNPGGNTDNSHKIVFAGEEDAFDFSIDVKPRYNPETDGEYATVVRGAKWRLGLCIGEVACNSESYNYSNEGSGNLNESYLMEGAEGIKKTLNINIPDIAAGSRICVVAEVWPADSGSFTNWQVSGYTNSWKRSPRACYTVAKKPSIQFWGGNVFSRGNLVTSTAVKNNLAGYPEYAYSAKEKKGTFVFGSWGELGVVGNGTISGFGSGASMGYGQNGILGLSPNSFANNSIVSNPGGGRDSSFCKRIPLTIPNSPCDDPINGLSSAINITKAASDKESIVTLLASGDASKMTNYAHYDTDETITKAGYNAIGETIDGSTTRVVSSDGSITIGSDLDYLNGEYTGFSQMPKLIIYAKKNIYIDCGVNRIDALLIANDTVVTCNNFENDLNDNNVKKRINDPDNSVQLTVNGAIIAKRLIPNRTYGAATGVNSIVPAEIVNFDPTLYQFGGSAESDDDTTGRLDMTYIHELAPRL